MFWVQNVEKPNFHGTCLLNGSTFLTFSTFISTFLKFFVRLFYSTFLFSTFRHIPGGVRCKMSAVEFSFSIPVDRLCYKCNRILCCVGQGIYIICNNKYLWFLLMIELNKQKHIYLLPMAHTFRQIRRDNGVY